MKMLCLQIVVWFFYQQLIFVIMCLLDDGVMNIVISCSREFFVRAQLCIASTFASCLITVRE